MDLAQGRQDQLNVVIVGAGLVGCLEAIYLARNGHRVTVYEKFKDPRTWGKGADRSLTLTLSPRGQTALREVGLEARVLQQGVLLKVRLIHNIQGNTTRSLYSDKGEGIYVVQRTQLNSLLIKEAVECYNIPIHFEHTFVGRQVKHSENGSDDEVYIMKDKEGKTVTDKADLLIGADGAHSAVRHDLFLKKKLDLFKQQYHDHWYIEVVLPPGEDGKTLMDPDMLHVWPRGEYMLVTFPNLDNSYSGSLFLPPPVYQHVMSNETELLTFFRVQFPDVVKLVGEDYLKHYFFEKLVVSGKMRRPGRLIANQVQPYHSGDSVLLMGDAAHAIVPFYGMGMNSGFEDCWVLHQIFQKHGYSKGSGMAKFTASHEFETPCSTQTRFFIMSSCSENLGQVLREFSNQRCKDGHAICDMAYEHYALLSSKIAGVSYHIRKLMDDLLFKFFPQYWVPEFVMVTFTNKPFSECRKEAARQKRVISQTLTAAVITFTVALLAIFWRLWIRF
ncbi:unnamed protein product [Lymnaea stagnalis]|uniref:FAD-binding domain-containing protein n=1 Tax=Lymnaea stagnalis TaxID=6523 RepID=A0AAV2I8T2_LYMST